VQSGMAMSELILLLIGSVLIVGIILAYRGIRGVPVLSDPKCTRCGYDLRWIKPEVNVVCPECGSDLTARRAIRFAEYQRRPRLVLAGLGLVVVAFVAPVGLRFLLVRSRVLPMTPASRASLPTSGLIANLATTASQPWDWQELERRLGAGRLSKQEIAAAVDQLIKHMQTKPEGWRGPLDWASNFLSAAEKGGFISDEQFGRLALAFYGPKPAVKIHGRLRQGQPFEFEIWSSTNWDLLDLKMMVALSRLTLDGTRQLEVRVAQQSANRPADPDQLTGTRYWPISGKVFAEIAPGKHNLVFEIDTGLHDGSRPFKTGDINKPGQAKRWPKTRHRWSTTVTVPIEVVASDRQAIELVTDEKLDPVKNGQLSVTAKLFARSETKSVLDLAIREKGLGVPIASEVVVKIAGREVRRGMYCVDPSGLRRYDERGGEIDRPAPAITTIDVILTPSVDVAENDTFYDRIWGKEMVFQNVPLQREDLEDAVEAPATPPRGGAAASRPR
jgi:hypothetical protein